MNASGAEYLVFLPYDAKDPLGVFAVCAVRLS